MQEDKYKGMRGEFKGDFTRDTFDPINQYSRVLMQQGRVQLDADWNEQVSIMLHNLRSLACDLGSEHWGPNGDGVAGFEISAENDPDFSISAGHYYVKGILCEAGLDENDDPFLYSTQPNFPLPDGHPQTIANLIDTTDTQRWLIYLDVWERHITYVDDDSIREVALGGPDTATRAKTIWQVKIQELDTSTDSGERLPNFQLNYQAFLDEITKKPGTGELCAQVKDKSEDNDPCLVAPESRYRGAENQLYRVEIHHPGSASADEDDIEQGATFKWSRENASVIFPVLAIDGEEITLEHLGRDCRYGLEVNDWVEIIDDDQVLRCEPGLLVQVVEVSREDLKITVQSETALPTFLGEEYQDKHVLLRRWDQNKGDQNAIEIVESSPSLAEEHWIDLEEGIQIKFKGNEVDVNGNNETPSIYQTGDYWLIPARTATGNVEWPKDDNDDPISMLPHGVIHHYAPLAILNLDDGEVVGSAIDLRRILIQLWE